MEIRTERLTLRPITMGDLRTTHAYVSDEGNTHFMMNLPSESEQETAEEIAFSVAQWELKEPERLEFAAVLDGAHIGAVTIFFQEDRTCAEIGWVLHRDHWGHGYAFEAARALIGIGHERWGLRRIFACCDSENAASARVMEKLGMQFVSRLGGRRNRGMDDERIELTYEIHI